MNDFAKESPNDWANMHAHSVFQDAINGLSHLEPEDVPSFFWEPLEEAMVDLAMWVKDHGVDISKARFQDAAEALE